MSEQSLRAAGRDSQAGAGTSGRAGKHVEMAIEEGERRDLLQRGLGLHSICSACSRSSVIWMREKSAV